MNRILIVDDEPSNVLLLESILTDSATKTRSVTDSLMVERTFREFEPDIVLLDLRMPRPDGLELLRQLRSARESLGFLPVIMLTADATHVARNSAFVLGANDFLTKPFDRTEVILRVRNLLRTRELYVELLATKQALERRLASATARADI
jgi:putative two-component system response regulator